MLTKNSYKNIISYRNQDFKCCKIVKDEESLISTKKSYLYKEEIP